MNAFVTGTGVSILSACAALTQPWAGRALDGKRLSYGAGTAVGLLLCAAGFISAATIPGLTGLLAGAITIGFGASVLTPLGFACLAACAPAERLGETMGAAEARWRTRGCRWAAACRCHRRRKHPQHWPPRRGNRSLGGGSHRPSGLQQGPSVPGMTVSHP